MTFRLIFSIFAAFKDFFIYYQLKNLTPTYKLLWEDFIAVNYLDTK